jgi:hypothetical protein
MGNRVSPTAALVVGLAVLLALAAGARLAAGQDSRLEAARKEGKVVWYTSLARPPIPASPSRCTAPARSACCSG